MYYSAEMGDLAFNCLLHARQVTSPPVFPPQSGPLLQPPFHPVAAWTDCVAISIIVTVKAIVKRTNEILLPFACKLEFKGYTKGS